MGEIAVVVVAASAAVRVTTVIATIAIAITDFKCDPILFS
jgi:hypothetical protein